MLLNNRKLTFIFRCPHTGRDVQAWSEADLKTSPAYEPVTCLACLSVHLVDPKYGTRARKRQRRINAVCQDQCQGDPAMPRNGARMFKAVC
jgi:hypothetical protein